MKYFALLALLLAGCGGGGQTYYPATAPACYDAYPGSDPAIFLHGDGRAPDYFFGDGTGGGMILHGDGQPADFIF